MPQKELRYLEIFDSNGDWIPRADYYVLATILEPELDSALHTHASMLLEDELRPSVWGNERTKFAQQLEDKFKNKSLSKKREIAGHVMFELVRIAAVTNKPPSLISAYHLAAHWYQTEYGHGVSDRKAPNLTSSARYSCYLCYSGRNK